jgi:branched-chain amino acid transport system ATP-binding protein
MRFRFAHVKEPPAFSGHVALAAKGLSKSFGAIRAVDDLTFEVPRNAIVAVIGPNGAGKSTLLSVLAGSLRAREGHVWVGNQETTGWPAHRVARLGVIRTFQVARDFTQLSVVENMLIAPSGNPGERLANVLLRPRACGRAERKHLERAMEILDVFELADKANDRAGELSGGQRRLLELARAMMTSPRILLLDEPMAGVSPVLAEKLMGHLLRLRDTGVTLVLVEHNLAVVEELSDWVLVMANGRELAQGTMATVRANPAVREAYLRGGAEAVALGR